MSSSFLTLLASLAASPLPACTSGSYEQQEFRRGDLRYKTGVLSSDWKKISVEDANLTFRHKDGGAIVANGMCGDQIDDVPLDVLTNHLLFGVEHVQEVTRDPFTLDGRGALRTRVRGELDGVPIEMDLVVVKKDGCSFDFQLVAGKKDANNNIEARRPDFERFFKGFAKLGAK